MACLGLVVVEVLQEHGWEEEVDTEEEVVDTEEGVGH